MHQPIPCLSGQWYLAGGEAAAEPDALSAEAAGGADAPADADTAEAEEEIDLDDDFDLTDRGLEEVS